MKLKRDRLAVLVSILWGCLLANAAAAPWEQSASIPSWRSGTDAVTFNGRIFLIGGFNGGDMADVITYDGVGSTWAVTNSLPAGRVWHRAGVLNGSVYVVGGNGPADTVYRFDGTSWTTVSSLPSPRTSLGVGVLNNYLYAIGGNDGSADMNTVYRFDGSSWSTVTPLPIPLKEVAVATLGSYLYVMGGDYNNAQGGHTNVYRFDGSTWTSVAGLPSSRRKGKAATVGGAIYFVGGYNFSSQTNVYRFDGTSWLEVDGLPSERDGHGVTVLDGKLYCAGGADIRTFRYDPPIGTTIYFSNTTQTYNGVPCSVSGMTIPTNVSFTVTYNGSSSAPTNAGTYAITGTVTQAGYVGRTVDTLTIQQADQTISFPAIPSQTATGQVVLAATASSGLPVSFVVVSGPCTRSGDTLSFTGEGTVVVAASQAGNVNYTPAPTVTNTFAVSILSQTISFPAIPSQTVTDQVVLTATASSGLPVSFAVVSGPCTRSGDTLSFTGEGTVVVAASQAGNANYNPAPTVTNTFTVSILSQTISFPAIPSQTVTGQVVLAATASSGLPVAFEVVSGPGILPSGTTTLRFSGTGVVMVAASQAGNATYSAAPTVTNTVNVSGATTQSIPTLNEWGMIMMFILLCAAALGSRRNINVAG